jgi:hypothetical protein
MNSNWENFFKNLGEWQGSFTQVSIDGEILGSTPSILTLTDAEDRSLVKFRVRRFAGSGYDEPPKVDFTQEYRSLGRPNIFFDNGSFSKSTIQLSPFAEFGAEYGFIANDRRLRFVQMFDTEGKFNSLTLIREFRMGSGAVERPPLTITQLYGKWSGEATTCYADLRNPDTFSTSLEITDLGGAKIQQQMSFGDRVISSTGIIDGNRLLFEDGNSPRRILLLPDGGSSNSPLQLPRHQEFFVETGWLNADGTRQRLIRNYSDRGEWISATHIIEERISN